MERDDIDVRPVPVDKLVTMDDPFLEQREGRIDVLLAQYQNTIDGLRQQLEKSEGVHVFLTRAKDEVVLAIKLKRGDVVRVVCPHCKGSGQKPIDPSSGRIHTPSAFEAVGGNTPRSPVTNPALRCSECDGRKWVLMDRFKG